MAKTEFTTAPEIQEIAERILARPECAEHLMVNREMRITYLFMDGPETSSWAGRCYRTVGPFQRLTAYDFVIVAFKKSWDKATEHAKEALVFHELMHVGWKMDKKGNVSYCLRDHFIETFPQEVLLYGTWNESLEALKNAFNGDAQFPSSMGVNPE